LIDRAKSIGASFLQVQSIAAILEAMLPRVHVAVFALVGVGFGLVPRMARADVVPPAGDCSNKKEGDPCRDEAKREGACGTISSTATNHATDPPTESQRSYFGCRAGVAPTSSTKKCSVVAVGARAPRDGETLALALAAVAAVLGRRRANSSPLRRR
jgi:hypothetical protein